MSLIDFRGAGVGVGVEAGRAIGWGWMIALCAGSERVSVEPPWAWTWAWDGVIRDAVPLVKAPALDPKVVSGVCAGCELGTGAGTGVRVDTGTRTWAGIIGGTVVGRDTATDAALALVLGTTAAGCV